MRLFIAIPLPSSAATSLQVQTHKIAPLATQLRWLQPESWHLTLQFLGSVAPERADALVNSLGTANGIPTRIQFASLECFDRAGALVAMIRPDSELDALQRRVLALTLSLGFTPESRPFTPHVTLARWKGSLPRSTSAALHHAEFEGEFIADRFALFQSFTEPSGARYQILRSYPLA